MHTRLLTTFSAGLLLFAASASLAFSCDHCGCADACQKTCRLVCEQKKVEITCWGCKCEDFCVPGPSKPGCKHCETVCEDCAQGCDPNGVHYQSQKFVWTEWIPGCATIRTRKKLMKKTITKTIPSYKWVVEDLCPRCQTNAQSVSVPAGSDIPQPPTAVGKNMTVLPVGYFQLEPSATTSTAISDEQPAPSFPAPPVPQVPTKPATTGSSWRDALKLPWQR